MANIFIGGSRNWDREIAGELSTETIYNFVEDLTCYCDCKNNIYVGDCPAGVDLWVIEAFIELAIERFYELDSEAHMYIVSNGECRINVKELVYTDWEDVNDYITFVNLNLAHKNGDIMLSNVLQALDITTIDWSDQSIKDYYMMELCEKHRFFWNGTSRATERNMLYSNTEDAVFYVPYILPDKSIVWQTNMVCPKTIDYIKAMTIKS